MSAPTAAILMASPVTESPANGYPIAVRPTVHRTAVRAKKGAMPQDPESAGGNCADIAPHAALQLLKRVDQTEQEIECQENKDEGKGRL